MTDRFFVDTNVLIYARDTRDFRKQSRALQWLDSLRQKKALVVSHQILAEYYSVVRARLRPGLDTRDARLDLSTFMTWTVITPDTSLYSLAFAVEDTYRFSWWDCLIVAAAMRGGCTHLLTEDIQHGQDLGGLKVLDPFRAEPASVLGA